MDAGAAGRVSAGGGVDRSAPTRGVASPGFGARTRRRSLSGTTDTLWKGCGTTGRRGGAAFPPAGAGGVDDVTAAGPPAADVAERRERLNTGR